MCPRSVLQVRAATLKLNTRFNYFALTCHNAQITVNCDVSVDLTVERFRHQFQRLDCFLFRQRCYIVTTDKSYTGRCGLYSNAAYVFML